MNASPTLNGVELHTIDGHAAMRLVELSWWQSRMVAAGAVPPLPEIIHPVQLLQENGYANLC